jgi:dTDP-L-rhamnose 4-epimerase
MRVTVTGGAGFVGSHVVDLLVARGHDVVVLDSLSPAAHAAPPDYLHPGARYLWGDVTDQVALRAAVAESDAVCHQAARVGLGRDFGDVDSYVRDNGFGTAVLLRLLHETGFRGRLVLASSMVVYGEGAYRCAQHGHVRPGVRSADAIRVACFEPPCPYCGSFLTPEAVSEDAPVDPRSVYAATKVHQEHLCAVFGREHDVPVTSLRYHNVYGPRMPNDTPYAGVASIFRSDLAAGRAPRILEDGRQLRDFVHVRDVARANVLAIELPDPVDGPVNIASGTPRTVGDLASCLWMATGAPVSLRPLVVGGTRSGDVRHVFATVDRARTRLGFASEVDFADGIDEFAGAPLRLAGAPLTTR